MIQAKPIDLKHLVRLIRGAESILIATHLNPDGDGIGSMLALAAGLKSLGKKVTCYTADPLPQLYAFLPGSSAIRHQLKPRDLFDISFIVDLGDVERVGEEFLKHPGRGQTISVDHHLRGVRNADLDYCLPQNAASGEVVYKVLKALKVKFDKNMAMGMFTAIVTDTGSFKYSNTTTETFEIATELSRYGVDVWKISMNVFETYSLARLELLKRVLKRLCIHESGKVAWIDLTLQELRETRATIDDAEGFITYPRGVEGVEVALSFREVDALSYKVSFRSKSYVDVGRVAEKLGGGGHRRASGVTLQGSLDAVHKQVLAAILPLLR